LAEGRLPTTRLELLRGRRRLERVRKGRELLRRKREALVRELLRLVRPAADARAKVAARAAAAYESLAGALAVDGAAALAPLGWPPRPLTVELQPREVWGVAAPLIGEVPAVRRSLAARGLAPTGVSPVAAETADAFAELVELLLAGASRELLLTRLGAALAATSRQVQTLERRVAPRLAAELRRVERTLDERERESRLQTRHLLRGRGESARAAGYAPAPRPQR
jgi:V/A-type H+-transporting ATPase subunit D